MLVTSNRTALIELIPDSLSIHTIKAKSPPGTSLRDHFIARHGQVYAMYLSSCVRMLSPGPELGTFLIAGNVLTDSTLLNSTCLSFVTCRSSCH